MLTQRADERIWGEAAMTKALKLLTVMLLTTAPVGVVVAQDGFVAPSVPSDSGRRTRTPEAQAILDASIAEEVREMKLLGIRQLRTPKNATNPASPDFTNYDEAKANPFPNLPPLMKLADGTPVKTRAQWEKRRGEIKALFDSEIYGKYPANIPGVSWSVESVTEQEVEGVPAVVKRVIGRVDNSAYPGIEVVIKLDVVTPASAKGKRVPMIVGPSLQTHPLLRGTFTQVPGSSMCLVLGPEVPQPQAQLLRKGWGFVSVNGSEVQPDNGAGLTKGIIGLVNKGQPRAMDDWGVLRAWAWANSRALDYLLTDKDVDGARVGIMGHSRTGKSALVTIVDDPRFAVGFISASGAGGANLYRRNYGEQPENVAAPNEYHWMAGNFLKYAAVGTSIDTLPVDSHQFVALIAPRPVFIGGGDYIGDPPCAIPGDAWQDAHGMFLSAAAASPAWELLGAKGLGTGSFPVRETFINTGKVGFRQHPYGHTPNPNWSYFIQFADRQFAGK